MILQDEQHWKKSVSRTGKQFYMLRSDWQHFWIRETTTTAESPHTDGPVVRFSAEIRLKMSEQACLSCRSTRIRQQVCLYKLVANADGASKINKCRSNQALGEHSLGSLFYATAGAEFELRETNNRVGQLLSKQRRCRIYRCAVFSQMEETSSRRLPEVKQRSV